MIEKTRNAAANGGVIDPLAFRLVEAAYDAEMQADDMVMDEWRDNARNATVAVLRTLAAAVAAPADPYQAPLISADELANLADQIEKGEEAKARSEAGGPVLPREVVLELGGKAMAEIEKHYGSPEGPR